MVEDNDLVAEALSEALSRAGHNVDHSITPGGATHRIVRNSYDLVLMDLALPEYDGDKLAAEMRDVGFAGPIIALTGGLLTIDKELAERANFAAVLRKPILPDDLVAAVDQFL